jgi:aspartate racemase
MKDPFYSAALKKRGLSPIPVDSDSLQLINKSIYQELVLGHCSAATQEMYKMACKRAAEHGADSVLLACTEIPLFIETSPWELPAVDTLECHVLEAAKKAGLFQ